jgi:hypothetical protein
LTAGVVLKNFSFFAFIRCALIAIALASCVRVPDADPVASGPSVDEVVRRIKCDLVKAVRPLLYDAKNTWLQTWVAQGNLTFIVNDASTLTPGATLTQPLPLVTIPGRVTNFGQSANLGLGGGYNTTASRNETVTFSLSLEELADQHLSDPEACKYAPGTDLKSELGLGEWIDAALTPAQRSHLVPGHHKSSKGGSTGATSSTSSTSASGSTTSQTMLSQIYTSVSAAKSQFKEGLANLLPQLKAAPRHRTTIEIVDNGVQRSQVVDNPIKALSDHIGKELDDISKSEIDDPTTIVTTSVTGITPQKGSSLGGTYVMVIGANFDKLDNSKGVTIDGLRLTGVEVKNDSTLCGYTPAHYDTNSGNLDVVVNASGGAGTKTGVFSFVSPPGDISINPWTAPIGAETTVQIIRSNDKIDLSQTQRVTVGGLQAKIIAKGPQSITALFPQRSTPGLFDVASETDVIGPDSKPIKWMGQFTYNNSSCPQQAASKKKIIAYVDPRLSEKIYAALFETRELIVGIEVAMQTLSDSDPNWAVYNQTLQATKSLQDMLLTLQVDPPLDAIGHQVQFIIVYNASVTPSWTLVNFKGPSSSSGSGASGSKTRTHTLNIALGPPGSADVASTLGALQLGTAVGNSLSVNGLSVPIQ